MENKITLKFPKEYLNHKYSLIHFSFFIQYAKIAGVVVDLVESNDIVFISDENLIFSCLINDKQVVVDYADHSTKNWRKVYPAIPYFKFQCNGPLSDDIIPLGPPMVGVKKKGSKGATLREYNNIRYRYDYQPDKNILCKQMPNGAALERRTYVHKMLKENFDDIDISYDNDQIDFWKMHENCLTAICVPGATNNMVDRGHIELMGLGVCTISPELYTIFPKMQKLESDKHYIKCKDDYSDIPDIINRLRENPNIAKTVGNNARRFYDAYYTPEKYWEWIMENLQ